jgi:hypothetical protein
MQDKRWVLEVQADPDNPDGAILEFPPEMLEGLGWSEGDVLTWSDLGDGSWSLSKKSEQMDK